MSLDFNQLRELLAAIAQTDIAELTLKSADFELTVRKGMHATHTGDPMPSRPGDLAVSGFVATPPPIAAIPTAPSSAPDVAQTDKVAAPPATATPGVNPSWVKVPSPMVGTFYRAPGPDESPFVEVGDRIRVGQTVCIIEAMKLMNEIEAEVSGQVMEILVKNGDPVEYGQTLMLINPES